MTVMRSVLASAAIVLCASTVRAQEPSTIGITMGYPASVGALLKVSDKIAIRPAISFGGDSTSMGGINTATSHTFTIGADALLYWRKYDRLRTYVAPHLAYARGSNSLTPPPSTGVAASSFTNSGVDVAGFFGAQYGLGNHFGVYGEAGLGYSHMSTSGGVVTGLNGTTNAWGTRAGVGVVFWP